MVSYRAVPQRIVTLLALACEDVTPVYGCRENSTLRCAVF